MVTPDAGNYDVVMPDGTTKNQAFAKGEFNIAAAPLYFVRSGYISMNNGRLRNSSIDSDYWSHTTAAYASPTSASAYYLNFNTSGVDPSSGPNNHWYGFPLRCLAL